MFLKTQKHKKNKKKKNPAKYPLHSNHDTSNMAPHHAPIAHQQKKLQPVPLHHNTWHQCLHSHTAYQNPQAARSRSQSLPRSSTKATGENKHTTNRPETDGTRLSHTNSNNKKKKKKNRRMLLYRTAGSDGPPDLKRSGARHVKHCSGAAFATWDIHAAEADSVMKVVRGEADRLRDSGADADGVKAPTRMASAIGIQSRPRRAAKQNCDQLPLVRPVIHQSELAHELLELGQSSQGLPRRLPDHENVLRRADRTDSIDRELPDRRSTRPTQRQRTARWRIWRSGGLRSTRRSSTRAASGCRACRATCRCRLEGLR